MPQHWKGRSGGEHQNVSVTKICGTKGLWSFIRTFTSWIKLLVLIEKLLWYMYQWYQWCLPIQTEQFLLGLIICLDFQLHCEFFPFLNKIFFKYRYNVWATINYTFLNIFNLGETIPCYIYKYFLCSYSLAQILISFQQLLITKLWAELSFWDR